MGFGVDEFDELAQGVRSVEFTLAPGRQVVLRDLAVTGLDTVLTEGGSSYVRHVLIDFTV